MIVAILWTAYAPESPHFLLKSRNFDGLQRCFEMVMRMNGKADHVVLARIIMKLKEANPEIDEVAENNQSKALNWTSPTTIKNLVAVCYLWSQSGFTIYLLLFYTKYMRGDFFVNYSVSGISDGMSMVYVAILSRGLGMKGILNFMTAMQIALSMCLYYAISSKSNIDAILPLLIVFLRLQAAGLSSYAYEINNELFPVLMRASVFGISNFVSRPLSSLGPFTAEFTSHPEVLIIVSSLLLFVAVSQIKKYEFD